MVHRRSCSDVGISRARGLPRACRCAQKLQKFALEVRSKMSGIRTGFSKFFDRSPLRQPDTLVWMATDDAAARKRRRFAEHEADPRFMRCGDPRRLEAGKPLHRDRCRYSCCSKGAAALQVPGPTRQQRAVDDVPARIAASQHILDALPVAELKRRLVSRGISCSGCLEKGELLELLRTAELPSAAPAPAVQAAPASASAQGSAACGAYKRSQWSHANQRPRESVQCGLGFALAENYDSDDLSGYVAMEKYDGIRFSWEPASRLFRTRAGSFFQPPPSLLQLLPDDMRLDGEAWVGRGRFSETLSCVRQPLEEEWSKVTFIIFDAPAAGGPFVERLAKARTRLAGVPPDRMAVVATEACEDAATVERLLSEVVAKGGEGLVLRRAASLFSASRSRDMLKVKEWHDAEAVVIRSNRAFGKASLHVRSLVPPGIAFDVAWSRDPPLPKTVLTYKYMPPVKGEVPRFPKVVRVHRADCDCEPCVRWRATG